jgi:hypothetical protein
MYHNSALDRYGYYANSGGNAYILGGYKRKEFLKKHQKSGVDVESVDAKANPENEITDSHPSIVFPQTKQGKRAYEAYAKSEKGKKDIEAYLARQKKY